MARHLAAGLEMPGLSEDSARLREGARNLLAGAARLKRGERLLIVIEPPGAGFYDESLGPAVATEAEALGAAVKIVARGPSCGLDAFPGDIAHEIAAADCAVFLSRLGSQARFLKLPQATGRRVMSYTLDRDHLADWFGRSPYGFFQAVHDRIVARIAAARRYSIRCANGTSLDAALPGSHERQTPPMTPFAVTNFPVMIFPPVAARAMTGRLALTLALISTGVHIYEDSVLPLPEPVFLDVEQGRIIGVAAADMRLARSVEAHLDRVGRLFSCDARRIDSWHTGLNPTTFYAGDAHADMERWGDVVFGSPRYTHFHMVGANPGEVCGQLFDATIAFDDEVFWDEGRFIFLDRPEMKALADQHGVHPDALATRRDIGLTPA